MAAGISDESLTIDSPESYEVVASRLTSLINVNKAPRHNRRHRLWPIILDEPVPIPVCVCVRKCKIKWINIVFDAWGQVPRFFVIPHDFAARTRLAWDRNTRSSAQIIGFFPTQKKTHFFQRRYKNTLPFINVFKIINTATFCLQWCILTMKHTYYLNTYTFNYLIIETLGVLFSWILHSGCLKIWHWTIVNFLRCHFWAFLLFSFILGVFIV